MAEQNKLNFLIEFGKSIKDCNLIIFTTYTFDPIFFDNALLRKLRKNNPQAHIIILIDGNMYESSFANFTEATGKDYLLIPIFGNLFHPKLFLFLSDKEKKAFIGSHNLTLPGLSHNLELSYVTTDENTVLKCLEYVESVLSKHVGNEVFYLNEIRNFLTNFTHYNNSLFITNQQQPILDQIINKMREKFQKISEVTIFSPFFSSENMLLEKINSNLNPDKIKLCIQKNNHNFNPQSIVKINNLELYEVSPKKPEQNRRMHSKFIIFTDGKNTEILIGSPNFTKPALLQPCSKGNFEAAILAEIKTDRTIMEYLDMKKISSKDIQQQIPITETEPTGIVKEVLLYTAYLDRLGRLVIDYSSKSKDSVQIQFLPSKKMTKISIDEDRHQLILSNPIPSNEIRLIKNDYPISNTIRIYNPPSLRLPFDYKRGDISLALQTLSGINEVPESLDFLTMFIHQGEETTPPSGISKPPTVLPKPGRIHKLKAGSSYYEFLSALLKISREKNPIKEKPPGSKSSSQTKKDMKSEQDLQKNLREKNGKIF